jgi:hypothetical protein
MWVNESERCVFYYIEYGILDLNSIPTGNMPFIIGIQRKWQMQMMIIHGNKRAISFYATFGTNTQKVLHSSIAKISFMFYSIHVSCA